LDALTGIRFFAAIYVVLYHSKLPDLLGAHHHTIAANFIKNGFISVSLFFLLSGFILSYTYSGRVNSPSERRRFWEARIARLYPVYLLSLVVTALVHLSVPKWSYAIPTLLMVQAWNPLDRGMWGAWNYVCWTLSVEAFFYILFPFYQRGVDRLSLNVRVVLTVIMVVIGILINSGVRVLGYPSAGILAVIPLPLLRLPEFFAGIGLGNLFLYGDMHSGARKKSLLPASHVTTYLALIASLLLLCRAVGSTTSLVLIPFVFVIFGLAAERTAISRLLSTKVLVFGGGIGYAVYLLQVAAKDFVITAAIGLHMNSVGLRFVSTIVILFIASSVTFLFVEIPGRDAIRSYFANREKLRNST
jgi:peptidoglycan/LPS O-acetylase OafA/YrhL